ncbi:DNA repair family protein [Xylariaceae sp. FL1272]|nr:DNA repair family protein [Xylariaceae sp. FL1272]
MPPKRTLEAYFSTPQPKQPRLVSTAAGPQHNHNTRKDDISPTSSSPSLSYSSHPSYPFPIPNLPPSLEDKMSMSPVLDPRILNDQPDLDLLYFSPYISTSAAKQLFFFLRSELPFYRVEYDIARGGTKTHIRTPRWTTVFGVDETARFSGPGDLTSDLQPGPIIDAKTQDPIPVGQPQGDGKSRTGYKATPRPIPRCLDILRRSTEAITGSQFNFCLVNYYGSGADSISFHSDDERFLGPDPCIASFSLGAKRDFMMKHKPPQDKNIVGSKKSITKPPILDAKPLKLPLASGDMILMRGPTQSHWLHSIPKRSGRNESDGGRINITFRRALVRGGTENYYRYNVGDGPVYKWNAINREMERWNES